MSDGRLTGFLRSEVADAITNGRMACKRPRWACRRPTSTRSDGRHKRSFRMRTTDANGGRNQSMRYVWSFDERRLYLISRERHETVVITVVETSLEREPVAA